MMRARSGGRLIWPPCVWPLMVSEARAGIAGKRAGSCERTSSGAPSGTRASPAAGAPPQGGGAGGHPVAGVLAAGEPQDALAAADGHRVVLEHGDAGVAQ